MYDSAVLSILVAQLLPLLLALLGAIVGVALGLLMGSQVTTRTWCVVIGLVSGLAIAGAAYLICDGYRIEARVRVLGETIRVEIDGGRDAHHEHSHHKRPSGGAVNTSAH